MTGSMLHAPTAWRGSARALVAALAGALLVLSQLAPAASAEPLSPVLADAPAASWSVPADIDSQAHVLMDAGTGQVLVADNADERRPVASTIKLLTAYTAIQRVALDELVTAGDEVLGVGGSGVGLEPGDEWTVEQLMDALLARSGNEAAETIAVHVAGSRDAFLRLMEQDAAELGVEGLTITSPSGLGDGNLLSAHDLAVIGAAVLDEPDLQPSLTRRLVTLPGQPAEENRNELLASYSGATGLKTGFTTAAGYSLVGSAQVGDRELIAVVLGAGEDPSRFDSAAALLDHGFDQTRQTEVGAQFAISVGGGVIELTVDPEVITVPVDSEASLQLSLPIRPPTSSLEVPVVVDGEPLGQLVATRSQDPAPVDSEAARLGRALVDGSYAALRAATAAGTLG